MKPEVDPRLVAAFGSETRVRTLAVLANAFRPLTAYRVGKVGGVPLPKVYREIERLAAAGLVERKGAGWVLVDPGIGALLRTRVRLSWAEDWSAEREARRPAMAALHERLKGAARAEPPKGFVARRPEEHARSPYKDERLRKMGLPTSVHAP